MSALSIPFLLLLLLSGEFRDVNAEAASSKVQICTSDGIFFREAKFATWDSTDVTFGATPIRDSLKMFKGTLDAVATISDRVKFQMAKIKSDELSTIGPNPLWYDQEREDAFILLTNVRPDDLATKCAEKNASLISFGGEENSGHAMQIIKKIAAKYGVTKLVPDAYYGPEGSLDRDSGRVLATYGSGLSYAAAIDPTTKYNSLVYDVTTKLYTMRNNVPLPKTLCRRIVPFYELSQTHLAVFGDYYSKLSSVLRRLHGWADNVLDMIKATPSASSIVPLASRSPGFSRTFELSKFFPSLLSFKDGYFHLNSVGDPLEKISHFIQLGEDFLATNPIINADQRELILKINLEKISGIVGHETGTIHPFIKVKFLRAHPDLVIDTSISVIKSGAIGVYRLYPLLTDGYRLAYDYLVLGTGTNKYMSHKAPSKNCLEIEGVEVCDHMIPSSADRECASYLFDEPKPGTLADYCPLVKSPLALFSIPDVTCLGNQSAITVVVARDGATLRISCRGSNKKMTFRVPSNSYRSIPSQYSSCEIRAPDGSLLRRADGPPSNRLLMRPFVINPPTMKVGDPEDEDDIKASEGMGEWTTTDILIAVLSGLVLIILKMLILFTLYYFTKCRNYCYNLCCCCMEKDCGVCKDSPHSGQKQDTEGVELGLLPGGRSRRSSGAGLSEVGQAFIDAIPKLEGLTFSQRSGLPAASAASLFPGSELVLGDPSPRAPPAMRDFSKVMELGRYVASRQAAAARDNNG